MILTSGPLTEMSLRPLRFSPRINDHWSLAGPRFELHALLDQISLYNFMPFEVLARPAIIHKETAKHVLCNLAATKDLIDPNFFKL
jgi:hypothetical protein